MGESAIFQVRHDAIKQGRDQDELAMEIGKAVLSLLYEPEFIPLPEGSREKLDRPIGKHQNGITLIDEIHSSSDRVFLWSRGTLRGITALAPEEVRLVKNLVDKA